MKQCSRKINGKQCTHVFPESDPRKMCERCRKVGIKHANNRKATEAGRLSMKKAQDKYHASDKGKARDQRFLATGKLEEWKKSDRGHQSILAGARKYKRSDKGKANARSRSVTSSITTSLCIMLKNHPNPVTVPGMGLFSGNDDVKAHFRSLFEPWMTFENHGKHLRGNAYNITWNIGHRIPVALYARDDLADITRCFNRRNLFPQCARENLELKDKLVLSDDQLLALKDLWPFAAKNDLSTLKSMYRRVSAS